MTIALRRLCSAMIAVRSKSVSASPEMTMNVSREVGLGVLDAAGRAQRRLLDRVVDVDAERAAVAEVAADDLGQERQSDDDVVDAVPLEQLDDVLHARLVADGHHRLGLVAGERPQARALSAGHDDGAHDTPDGAAGPR